MNTDDTRRRTSRAQRHERKRQLAKQPNPKCCVCGQDRIEMLEVDHVAGEANGDLTRWVCRNHHAAIHDRWLDDYPELLDHGGQWDADAHLAALLQGVVYFFEELLIKLREWIDFLLRRSSYNALAGNSLYALDQSLGMPR